MELQRANELATAVNSILTVSDSALSVHLASLGYDKAVNGE